MSINPRNPDIRSRKRKFSSGMTMVEVAFAMIILATVAGAIFATVRASLETASLLTQHQNREEEISGFIDLCRRTFQTLPPSASLEGIIDEKNSGTFRKIVFQNCPASFMWGNNAMSLNTTITLGECIQINGLRSISLLRETDTDETEELNPSDKQQWLPLVTDIQTVKWRFYHPQMQWVEDIWENSSMRPLLIEVNIFVANQKDPIQATFWLPPLTRGNSGQPQ
jgi:type II secretory pathway pseudopilin PulG